MARSSLAENIEKCIRGAGFEIAELLIAPISLGSSVLNASEKRSGCALVDIGADTTTVSMYTNNILRKLVVIPLGGNNATMDIATCLNIEIEEAESLKQKYGRAFLEDYEAIQHNIVKFSHDREIGESRLCDIIEARYEEILRNVWAQVEDDSDKLTSGIILTGGGAQIRSITEALQYITNSSKQIRIVKGLPKDITIAAGIYIPDNSKANGILSLLLHGDQNCVLHRVKPLNPDPDDETTEDDTTEETDITEEGTKPEVQTKNKKKSITDFFKIIAESLKEDE
ncbi:MAG: rod shape-determining protein [Bacteroidaceae bacterium]|nr:rod shape-determining protein [Bacteroidaceae bacterium]